MLVSNNFEHGEVINAPSLQRLTEQPPATQVLLSSFSVAKVATSAGCASGTSCISQSLDIGGEHVHLGQMRWRQPNHLRVHGSHLIVQP